MRRRALAFVITMFALPMLGALAASSDRAARAQNEGGGELTDLAVHQVEVETWREKRLASLRRPDGWLSLVGLFALPEGQHRLGSGPDATLTVPAGHPAVVGTLEVKGTSIQFTSAPGVPVRQGEEPVDQIVMQSDASGSPTTLEVGTLLFYAIERGGRPYLRVKDRNAPLLRDFDGIPSWPVSEEWRIVGHWVPYESPKQMKVPDILGNVDTVEVHGAVEFTVGGRTHRLEPTSAGDELFFVFGDATNGIESYGAGRFLYTDAPDAQGEVVLDFNRAYNPPCVFTPFATCPLPAEGNVLDVGVLAGEKMWGTQH